MSTPRLNLCETTIPRANPSPHGRGFARKYPEAISFGFQSGRPNDTRSFGEQLESLGSDVPHSEQASERVPILNPFCRLFPLSKVDFGRVGKNQIYSIAAPDNFSSSPNLSTLTQVNFSEVEHSQSYPKLSLARRHLPPTPRFPQ